MPNSHGALTPREEPPQGVWGKIPGILQLAGKITLKIRPLEPTKTTLCSPSATATLRPIAIL
ncbi:MAG: hypothetical protein Fur0025_27540 [Oscillatoriaceae cyanobacterium]